MILLVLAGCLQRPYPPYFTGDVRPAIDGVVYPPHTGFVGGTEATIEGSNLGTTQTVVVGGRNAVILEASDDTVRIVLPAHSPTSEPHDIALVTDDGIARLADAVLYESALGDFVHYERTSVALGTLSCPIDTWGLLDGEFDSITYCGGELGYADAIAFAGASTQPGYATELLGFGAITTAPPINQIAFWGPGDRRPPESPVAGGPQAAGDAIVFTRNRNFTRDFEVVQAALDRIYETYTFAYAIEDTSLVVALENADESLGTYDVFDVTDDAVVLVEAAPAGATHARFGYRFTEVYEDGDYETEAFFGVAAVQLDGDTLSAGPSEIALVYDEFTGFWFPEGEVGAVDVSRGQYAVSTERLGVRTPRGEIRGAPQVTGLFPDILTGDAYLFTDRPASFYWDPLEDEADPAIMVLELKVFDQDLDDPNGSTELYRITATAPDWFGYVAIPPDILGRLPARVENHLDENYDFTGLWGEATLTRHVVRRIPDRDGDLVVDVVHSTQAFLAFVR